ncbi:hypothetical protein AB0K60_34460 [Thermopolyspora sp. NPDC052614]|uniref:hypothetical protein n=1 Tax=Thermopolyspora sp. NPDC052614 TaxID=3155682 RepID=UPI0034154C67
MSLIALAADKGAPGVTTAATVLAAVWPRPAMLAECDAAGGDLAYRLPAEDNSALNPARGLLSLGATARRGLAPRQIHEHTQRLVGGLEVLIGINSAEQAVGLSWLWEPLGMALAAMPDADVVADCGRVGSSPAIYDLMGEAAMVVLFTRPHLDQVAHMRERYVALGRAFAERGKRPQLGVVVIAPQKEYARSLGEVRRVMSAAGQPEAVIGGLAYDVKGAELLRGEWGGRLERSLLVRSARELAAYLSARVAPGPSVVGRGA